MKCCNQCKQTLSISEFYPSGGKCKKCQSENAKAAYLRAKVNPPEAAPFGTFIVCIDCGKKLSATLEFFQPHPLRVYGLRTYCRKCTIERQRQWRIDKPNDHRNAELARAARDEEVIIGKHTAEDERFMWEWQGRLCHYCGTELKAYHTWECQVDHVVPKSGGGTDYPWNIVIACRSCNGNKKAKPLEEWLDERPDLNREDILTREGKRMAMWIFAWVFCR